MEQINYFKINNCLFKDHDEIVKNLKYINSDLIGLYVSNNLSALAINYLTFYTNVSIHSLQV